MNYALTLRAIHLVLPLALAACTIPKSLGVNPDDDTTGASDSATSDVDSSGGSDESGPPPETTTDETTTDGTTTDGGPACQNPAQMCGDVQIDCAEHNCGAIGSPFDAQGCLRESCDDTACGVGEVCFADESAGCSPSVVQCGLVDGACECNMSEDCGGRYCYPEGEAPPTDCNAITDEAACVAAGCQAVPADPSSIEDDMCKVTPPISVCVWFPGGGPGTGEPLPDAYYHQASQQVVLFHTRWDEDPYGWSNCLDLAGPDACECWFD